MEKVKTSSEFKADSIPFVKRLGQKQVDSVLLGLVMLTAEMLGQLQGDSGLSIKSVPKLKTNSDFIADLISYVKRLGQKQVDSVLLGPVMLTFMTRWKMLGECFLLKELREGLHVG